MRDIPCRLPSLLLLAIALTAAIALPRTATAQDAPLSDELRGPGVEATPLDQIYLAPSVTFEAGPDRTRPRERPPRHLPYAAGGEVPDAYVFRERRRPGLLVPGTVALSVGYLMAAGLSLAVGGRFVVGAVPVVGAFIAAADGTGTSAFIYVPFGMAQAVGLALLLVGILKWQRYYEYVGDPHDAGLSLQLGPASLGVTHRF